MNDFHQDYTPVPPIWFMLAGSLLATLFLVMLVPKLMGY